jgi:hypothetical protein
MIDSKDVLSPKRRGPQYDRTPWQYTNPSQSPSYFGPPHWFAAPLSSLSQTLYRTQVMHTHESSNTDNLHSWNIRCSDRKAQNSRFIFKKYRGWPPLIPSRSSTNQTAHRAWSLGFYSYYVTLSNMVTNVNCSCFAGY